MNLIVGILYHSERLKVSICNVRDTCKLVRSSSKNVLKLKNYAPANGEKDHKWWKRSFDTLNCALKLKKSLTDFSQTETQVKLTIEDWNSVAIVVD